MTHATKGPFKSQIRSILGRIVTQLQALGLAYQQEQRSKYLKTVCSADPTVRIDSSASVSNASGEPNRITIAASTAVLGNLLVFPQGGRIAIGAKTFVGPGTNIWSADSITIGSYVLIAHNVNIFDNISHSTSLLDRRAELDIRLPGLHLYAHSFDLRARPLVIEDDVWIGCGVTIIGGHRIGRGAIIGASAVVTGDVPPFSVVVGNPMRILPRLPELPRDPVNG